MDRKELEKLFPSLIENTNDVISIFTLEGKLLYVNFSRHANKDLHEAGSLMGNLWKEYVIDKDGGAMLREILDTAAGGGEWYGELPVENTAGGTSWIQSRFFPVRDNNDEIIYIGAIHRDITKLKKEVTFSDFRVKTEKVLSAISKRFIPPFDLEAGICDSLAEIGGLFDVDRVYIFRVDLDSGIMSNTHEWVADGVAPQLDNLQNVDMNETPWWKKQLEKGNTINIGDVASMSPEAAKEKHMLETQDIQSLIVVNSRPESAVTGFLGLDSVKKKRAFGDEDERMLRTAWEIISRGIEHHAGEIEKQQLMNNLIETKKYEAVGRLAAGVAHDFNNLMAVIMGNVSLLRGLPLAEDTVADKSLADIMEATEFASSLTSSLLSFSRRDSLQMAPVDINELVMETCRLARSNLSELVTIEEKYESGRQHIECDRNRIFQALVAILLNAGDAMPAGGRIRISVSGAKYMKAVSSSHFRIERGAYVRVSVTDEGEGMEEDVVEKVFDPFFTTKGPDRGVGLGLSHAFGAVSDHNGAIFVKSSPGLGSTFDVLLPVRQDM